MDDLAGKVFIVSGAASGLGRASAQRLARAGARLVLADVNEAGLARAAADLGSREAPVEALVVDVRRPEDCARMAERAVERFGALNGAVCSAGIDNVSPSLDLPLETWQHVLDVNLTGIFLSV